MRHLHFNAQGKTAAITLWLRTLFSYNWITGIIHTDWSRRIVVPISKWLSSSVLAKFSHELSIVAVVKDS